MMHEAGTAHYPTFGVSMLHARTEVGDRILSQVANDPELVIEFFAVFSRFEYSLKREGYWHPLREGVGVSWKDFADNCSSAFARLPKVGELSDAIQYYVDHTPMQQVIRDGELDWVEVALKPETLTLKDLLEAVRRVRNNLFHGGKFPGVPVPEPSRNEDLLRHGLTILAAVLSLDHPEARKVSDSYQIPLF